jgi:hypothetical protein
MRKDPIPPVTHHARSQSRLLKRGRLKQKALLRLKRRQALTLWKGPMTLLPMVQSLHLLSLMGELDRAGVRRMPLLKRKQR